MARTLLEAYAKKLDVADRVYSNTHEGRRMSSNMKIATAVLLNNVNRCLTEAFDNSIGTQRADMGDYKRFCLSITNVVFPSLIAEDLVIVKPMTSYSGVITYARYTYGSNKGGIKQGQVIADPWSIHARTEDNTRYTSQAVVENWEGGASDTYTPACTPVVKGSFHNEDDGKDYDLKIIAKADGNTYYLNLGEDGTVTNVPVGRIAYRYN